MNSTVTVDIGAPLAAWIPWIAAAGWIVFLAIALATAPHIAAWRDYRAEARQLRRWQAAGHVERRTIRRPFRLHRWQ